MLGPSTGDCAGKRPHTDLVQREFESPILRRSTSPTRVAGTAAATGTWHQAFRGIRDFPTDVVVITRR